MRTYSILAAALLLFAADMAQASCGSQLSFCMANTAWSMQGVGSKPGLRVDLHREYPWNFTRRRDISFGLKAPAGEREARNADVDLAELEFIAWAPYQRIRGVRLTADRSAAVLRPSLRF
jgi:hypothetical protein